MKKVPLLLFIFIFSSLVGISQGELDVQQKAFYRNEKSIGLMLNSTGYGLSLRYGKRIDFFNKRIFEGDISILKHPKEYKTTNPYFPNNRRFVFGKLNFAITLRGGMGFQHMIFKKIDQGGIAIRYIFSGGPSISLYKPIYYDVLYPVSLYESEVRSEKFNVSIHNPQDIYRPSSFFKGFDEIKIIPGAYGKAGINFEYSKLDRIIHAVEIGVTFDAFLKKIPIMASEDNLWFFPALFVSYRFGNIIDPKTPLPENPEFNISEPELSPAPGVY
ncbi:MAG: hypothetical protein KAT40_02695 [Bacteroidales bacterium]|nr:hypothetical protein [Bacteroidales bacterium]